MEAACSATRLRATSARCSASGSGFTGGRAQAETRAVRNGFTAPARERASGLLPAETIPPPRLKFDDRSSSTVSSAVELVTVSKESVRRSTGGILSGSRESGGTFRAWPARAGSPLDDCFTGLGNGLGEGFKVEDRWPPDADIPRSSADAAKLREGVAGLLVASEKENDLTVVIFGGERVWAGARVDGRFTLAVRRGTPEVSDLLLVGETLWGASANVSPAGP